VKVGDLVRRTDDYSTAEEGWVGVIIDFNIHVDNCGEPQERYAVVCWNLEFPEEEEYPSALEVINESR
jgi:hypothetical protein